MCNRAHSRQGRDATVEKTMNRATILELFARRAGGLRNGKLLD
jgi:hypothetical protein